MSHPALPAPLALITGASGGIGEALAWCHARAGGDLLLVARSADKLARLQQALQQTCGVRVWILPLDLSLPTAAAQLADHCRQLSLTVDYLINNAGVGGHGLFHEQDPARQEAMLQLNLMTLTRLTRLLLPAMVARGHGRILNVASTAAFLPGPWQAVYFASKAYVCSLSQALAAELAPCGITVTALCPGAVATGFVAAGDLQGVDFWRGAPGAESVARCGYAAMLAGKLVAFNDWRLRLLIDGLLPWLPRRWVLAIAYRLMQKQ